MLDLVLWTSFHRSGLVIPNLGDFILKFTEIFESTGQIFNDSCSRVISQVWNSRYVNNSLHLARKFVRGHRLLPVEDSFPKAKLKENCELFLEQKCPRKISEHIFVLGGGYCVYYSSNSFRNTLDLFKTGVYSVTWRIQTNHVRGKISDGL